MSRAGKGGPTEPGINAYIRRVDEVETPLPAGAGQAEMRQGYDRMCAAFRQPRPASVVVEDLTMALADRAIPLRVYRPAGDGPKPGLLYLHGGGFARGNLDSHDDVCAELAEAADVVVMAVDYRLAPEHRYPAALDDAMAALARLRVDAERFGVDDTRILVGGDSAGGNLSAALSLRLKAAGGQQVQGVVLIYPDLGGDPDQGSYVERAEAPMLGTANVHAYRGGYRTAEQVADPFVAPLRAADLTGLPPAYITSAEFDPLRDDGLRYAERLTAAGVAVTVRREPQMVHSWLRARHMSEGAGEGFRALCAGVRALGRS